MLGEKHLPLDALNRRGFVVTRPAGPKHIIQGFDYEAIWANPFLALDDAKYDGTHFVDFPDEMVEVARDGTLYLVFGGNCGGAFLVRNGDDTVHYAEVYELGGTQMNEMRFVNTDLRRFVRCHCFWQSLVWEQRALRLPGGPNLDGEPCMALSDETLAARLKSFVGRVDAAALENGHRYWASLAYGIADQGVMLYPFVPFYMRHGRFRLP